MFDNNRIFIAPDLDINKLLDEGMSYDQIEAKINEAGGNNREYKSQSFSNEFLEKLKSDKVKVDVLFKRWQEIKIDPKLTEFKKQIDNTFFANDKNTSGKLVIFTESKETSDKLFFELKKYTQKNILTVNSDNRSLMESTIRDNFDANLEEEKWKNDFDIIITTEVLAEGVNLHRANIIVNYDVPWNSTRLMQRIGRINRIGSRAASIYVYNYYPSAHGDAQIHLINNALRKLQSFHTAFGEDNKIFSLLEEKGEGALFGNKIQKEESEILKYLNALRDFKKKHEKRFKEISQIPNKSRCGRMVTKTDSFSFVDLDSGEINYPLINTSLTYLKSSNHPGIFCLITKELQSIELNFLQAVKIFEADENEKAIPLHNLHHAQTIAGFNYFKSEKNQENIQNITKRNFSPVENKALTNLRWASKHAPTEQKKMALLRAYDMIYKGTFASKGFPKIINDFFVNNQIIQKDTTGFINKLFIDLLDKYDLSANINSDFIENVPGAIINPKIVLTQSFSITSENKL